MSAFQDVNPKTMQPFKKGEKRSSPSSRRLKKLNFNPIDKLIALHDRLEREDQYWTSIREGSLVLLDDEGKPKKVIYKAMVHNAIFTQLQKVSADLLQYRYHKVLPPNGGNAERNIPEVNINLS
jgi:hypothetical protein